MRFFDRVANALRLLAGREVEFAVAADVDMHVEPERPVNHCAIKPQAFRLNTPKYVMPEDKLSLIIDGEDVTCGGVEIEREMTVDRAVTWRFDDDLGFKHAVACAFGEADKS